MPMILEALQRSHRNVRRLRDPKGVLAKGAALWDYWLQRGMVHAEVLGEEGPAGWRSSTRIRVDGNRRRLTGVSWPKVSPNGGPWRSGRPI